eukprot:scaffold348134_cov41-Attheya_sp.AAC.1
MVSTLVIIDCEKKIINEMLTSKKEPSISAARDNGSDFSVETAFLNGARLVANVSLSPKTTLTG